MTPEKALQIVQNIRPRHYMPRYRQPAPTVYTDFRLADRWTWDTATPAQRAHAVREHRKMGIMDWDLLDLFGLTREGLAAIVAGRDWQPAYTRS